MPWPDSERGPATDAAAAGPPAAPGPPGAGGPPAADTRSRDVEAAALLGWFHVVLAVPVLAGVAFAHLTIDRVLNVLAALALGAVGAFFLWWARRLKRGAVPGPSTSP